MIEPESSHKIAALGDPTRRRIFHIYRLDPQGIAALREYLDSLWERALNDFKAAAERSFNPGREIPR